MKQKKQSIFDKFPQLQTIDKERFPKHILLIPDGNGRWAKLQNKFVLFGHKKGAEVGEILLEDISEIKEIKAITVWGFAADNWKRSEEEVKGLMFLIDQTIQMTINKLKKRNGRFIHLGRKDRISQKLLKILTNAEQETKDNTGQILSLAIDFGGEDQNLRTLDAIRSVPKNTPTTQELLWQLRDGHGVVKSADLIIRTSGERRTSDIGWLNGSSSELFFLDTLFPDVTTADMVDAIVDFSKRERRFGGRKK